MGRRPWCASGTQWRRLSRSGWHLSAPASGTARRLRDGGAVRAARRQRLMPDTRACSISTRTCGSGSRRAARSGHVAGVVNALLHSGLEVDVAAVAPQPLVRRSAGFIGLRPPRSFGLPPELNQYRFSQSAAAQLGHRDRSRYAVHLPAALARELHRSAPRKHVGSTAGARVQRLRGVGSPALGTTACERAASARSRGCVDSASGRRRHRVDRARRRACRTRRGSGTDGRVPQRGRSRVVRPSAGDRSGGGYPRSARDRSDGDRGYVPRHVRQVAWNRCTRPRDPRPRDGGAHMACTKRRPLPSRR